MSIQDKPTEILKARPVPKTGQIISAVVVALLVIIVIKSLFTNPNFQWNLVGKYMFHPLVLSGVKYTILLTIGAMLIGIVIALTMAIMRQSSNPIMSSVAWFYIWFFRGTPVYTQLVFWGLISVLYPRISLGVPFGPEFFTFNTADVITAGIAALLGLGLNEGAYLSEIFRAGLNSVDEGQWEAGKVLGMKKGLILRRIVIPQAMRVIVPPIGNETISMLKTTSLVLAVPFTLDLTFEASNIGNRIFAPIPLLIVAALWYILITSILMIGQYFLERHYGRGFDKDDNSSKKEKRLSKKQIESLQNKMLEDFYRVNREGR
ncbi:amino acid ABC transporter permease [Actinomyces sp. zg-332]|uniref:amino acid ABC transporter permease n=1 Tax=Actinomyces sp. zg-332 TaxID=2708340 RepID=UPI00141D82FE|nr:amino acid ABC transporter permease [Actinomyces sp. zg-332]QPK93723.1 amino acid ABC transporter permease [Actinomyces sp. zg-332]